MSVTHTHTRLNHNQGVHKCNKMTSFSKSICGNVIYIFQKYSFSGIRYQSSVRNCAGPVAKNHQVLLWAISFQNCMAQLAINFSENVQTWSLRKLKCASFWLYKQKNIVWQAVQIFKTFFKSREHFAELLLCNGQILNANHTSLWSHVLL